MGAFMHHWILSLVVFIPALGAMLMAAIPGRVQKVHLSLGIITAAITTAAGVYLLAQFNYGNGAHMQFAVDRSWIPAIGSRYHLAVDGISLALVSMSILTMLLCAIYCWSDLPDPKNPKALLICMLLLETGINGTFLAQDLILFFVFFELALVPMYFIVGVWGGPNRQAAAMKFFVYTALGSTLMLVGFVGIYFWGGHTFDISQLASTNSALRSTTHATQLLLFGALAFGFGVKVPVFPFHTWMPDTHTEAPTVASVLLASVLLKLGAYGFIRIAIPMFPSVAKSYSPLLGLLAVIGIIYGALGCLAQRDMKRLIAFSSLAHMGFVMLGISTLTEYGFNAALFAMVAHGVITGMLFFLSGSVQHRLNTRDLNRFGGLLGAAPQLTWILGFCAIASSGLPGLAGFWGEFSSVLSAFQPATGLPKTTFRVYMTVGAVGTVLAAGYLLWMYQRIAFGPQSEMIRSQTVQDVKYAEYVAWAPLLILILVLGVCPSLLFGISNPAVHALMVSVSS
jgi:NADH-quinone oxidoreductase subunit M